MNWQLYGWVYTVHNLDEGGEGGSVEMVRGADAGVDTLRPRRWLDIEEAGT